MFYYNSNTKIKTCVKKVKAIQSKDQGKIFIVLTFLTMSYNS